MYWICVTILVRSSMILVRSNENLLQQLEYILQFFIYLGVKVTYLKIIYYESGICVRCPYIMFLWHQDEINQPESTYIYGRMIGKKIRKSEITKNLIQKTKSWKLLKIRNCYVFVRACSLIFHKYIVRVM